MSASVLLIAASVALAVLVGRGPRGRPARTLAGEGRWAWGSTPGVAVAARVSAWSRVRHGGRPTQGRDLAAVVTEVASQLRAGADPGRAWARALGRPAGADGMPDLADVGGVGDRSEAAAVLAASRLAAVLGAPLAQVLDRVASGLASAAEAEGDRRAALAGPRATVRVLTGLPILGAVLGAAVGADPVGVLLGGGVGTAALLVGVALLLLGRWWIARLVRAAARAGQDG